jgi:hypothetical protein
MDIPALGVPASLVSRPIPRTVGWFTAHRVGDTHHAHNYAFVPQPLAEFDQLSRPWRVWRAKRIEIPAPAIAAARKRKDIAGKLFVLWASERNARILYMLTRSTQRRRFWSPEQLRLRRRIDRLKKQRQLIERTLVEALMLKHPKRWPNWKPEMPKVDGGLAPRARRKV